MDDSKGETAPALGVSINAQVSPTRQLTLQTFVDRDEPQGVIDALLDKMNTSLDRLEAFYAIENAENQLEVDTNVLTNVTRRLAEVEDNIRLKAASETGRRNPLKLSAQEEVQKKQAHDSIEEAKRRIAVDKAIVAKLKKKAGNRDGTSSPADR
jgi:hypothetical protein